MAYEPTSVFGALATLDETQQSEPELVQPILPIAGATPLVTAQEWLSARASADASYQLALRRRVGVRYETARRRPVTGVGLESRSQSISAFHTWDSRRRLAISPPRPRPLSLSSATAA